MKTFRFLDFKVYKDSKVLYYKVLDLTTLISSYTLKDQIERASLSIVLNIAEGSAKKSDREFARFIQIALGSVNELVACLDVTVESNIITRDQAKNLFITCDSIAKQLGGFSKKLKTVTS